MGHWTNIKENRFNYLLTILVLLFVASPFMNVDGGMRMHPIMPTLYMLAVLGLLRTMIDRNKEFIILASIKLIGFTMEMLALNHAFPAYEHTFSYYSSNSSSIFLCTLCCTFNALVI